MITGIRSLSAVAALLLAVLADASPIGGSDSSLTSQDSDHVPWDNIKNMVVFGDSYTDEGRIMYMIEHNGTFPPVGYIQPVGTATASGGKVWARFATESAGVTLYNYAVSGAVCSSDLTPKFLSLINRNFPAIDDYELPAFKADFPKGSSSLNTDETLFTIWIGTNDIGNGGVVSGLPNVGLTNYTECVFDLMAELYEYGARKFAVLNLAPLEHAPLYAPPGPGDNFTDISTRMRDLTQGGNEIYKYRIPFEVKAGSLEGAKVAVVDVYGLMTDIRNDPARYLTGPPPLNVTGYNHECPALITIDNFDDCILYRPDAPDSFMWYDALHPSEQTSRVIGEEFAKVLKGESGEWITYW